MVTVVNAFLVTSLVLVIVAGIVVAAWQRFITKGLADHDRQVGRPTLSSPRLDADYRSGARPGLPTLHDLRRRDTRLASRPRN